MWAHKFLVDFFHNGLVKYRAGGHYEPSEETDREVEKGHAVEVKHDGELEHPFGHGPAQAPIAPTAADVPEGTVEKPAPGGLPPQKTEPATPPAEPPAPASEPPAA